MGARCVSDRMTLALYSSPFSPSLGEGAVKMGQDGSSVSGSWPHFRPGFLLHVLHHPTIGDIISKNYLKNIWSKSPEKWPWKSERMMEDEDETNGLHVFLLFRTFSGTFWPFGDGSSCL